MKKNKSTLIELNEKKSAYLKNNFRGRQLDYDYLLLIDRLVNKLLTK